MHGSRSSTSAIAQEAIRNGAAVVCSSREQMVDMVNRCAPEHLEIQCRDPDASGEVQHYGGAFGVMAPPRSSGTMARPEPRAPDGGTARYTGGLSVLTFIRVRTWIRIDDPRCFGCPVRYRGLGQAGGTRGSCPLRRGTHQVTVTTLIGRR